MPQLLLSCRPSGSSVSSSCVVRLIIFTCSSVYNALTQLHLEALSTLWSSDTSKFTLYLPWPHPCKKPPSSVPVLSLTTPPAYLMDLFSQINKEHLSIDLILVDYYQYCTISNFLIPFLNFTFSLLFTALLWRNQEVTPTSLVLSRKSLCFHLSPCATTLCNLPFFQCFYLPKTQRDRQSFPLS